MDEDKPGQNKNKNEFQKLEKSALNASVKTVRGVGREVKRWPGLVALALVGLIYAILPDRLTIISGWMLLPLLALLIATAILARLRGFHVMNHWLIVGAIGLATLTETISVMLLLTSLPGGKVSAVSLLRDASLLWVTNVLVFALWYWQLDSGGPVRRHHNPDYSKESELLFPQLTLDRPGLAHWRPDFLDYLFVAFNTSTAFSPTDTAVLSSRLKLLSMLQAVLSLVILATLAARAINTL